MGIWRSIFGWKVLFRWDTLGAVVPGIFIAVGLGMLGLDWFPRHLLIAQVCFAIAGALCLVKIIGHAIESDDTVPSKCIFGVLLGSIVLGGTVWIVSAIQAHKELVYLVTNQPSLLPPPAPKSSSPTKAPSATTAPPPPRHTHQSKQTPQTPKPKGLVEGSDNTVYGNVPITSIKGNGNTLVGPTNGTNTIIRGGTTVGNGAQGGPDSVVIGAHAGSRPRPNYARMSSADLADEIIRVSSSLTAFAEQNDAAISITTGILRRAASGNAKPGDPPQSTAQETYFRQSKDFTDAIKDQYFPEIAALREEALRRLDGHVQEDPQEKRNWYYIGLYLKSPPNVVTPTQMEEFAREFKKMGDNVDSVAKLQ